MLSIFSPDDGEVVVELPEMYAESIHTQAMRDRSALHAEERIYQVAAVDIVLFLSAHIQICIKGYYHAHTPSNNAPSNNAPSNNALRKQHPEHSEQQRLLTQTTSHLPTSSYNHVYRENTELNKRYSGTYLMQYFRDLRGMHMEITK